MATNIYREWTQRRYASRHSNINLKEGEIQEDRGNDGGTNFTLRVKEKAQLLKLQIS
jgi:hypothetical protein